MKIGPVYIYDLTTFDHELENQEDPAALEAYQKRMKFQKDAEAETQKQMVKDENDRTTMLHDKSTDSKLNDENLLNRFEADAMEQRRRAAALILEEENKKPQIPMKEMLARSSTTSIAVKISGEVYKL
jgi:hypothetical protein